MDYQQSIKNLNHLKNFVRAWAECHIFFFFISETDYEIKIYSGRRTRKQKKIIDKNLRSEFPYGYISNEKCGKEILYYRDKNIAVEYDLFEQQFNIFSCHDPEHPMEKKLLRLQFFQLTELLKNK